MTRSHAVLLALIVLVVVAFFAFDLGRFLSLESFKAQQTAVETYRTAHPWLAVGAYVALYVLVAGLSLPGATVLTLVGGAVFGLFLGTLIVSFASTIGATLVFVNAGTQLARIDSPQGILSPELVASFVLLGFFPLIAKKTVALAKARRVYAGWTRPKRFERNLIVIGAGAAGLVSAYIAAAVKARVTLVEKHRMGGDCLNTGCVPSKALIRTARLLSEVRRADELGVGEASADIDFAEVMERVRRVVRRVEPHDSVERYTGLGVEVIQGTAKILSPWEVRITPSEGARRVLTTRSIVIAAGARPWVPPIPGIEEVGYRTSDNLWELRQLPPRLLVLGGGPIGAEITQAFARLGSRVTQVEMLPRILMREDPEVSDLVTEQFRAEGIEVLVEHRAERFLVEDGQKVLVAVQEDAERRIPFDELLAEYVLAMRQGIGLNKILATIHIYPTLAEANKYAAGQWKKDHAPHALLSWAKRFHGRRLG